ncbi:MAG: glycine betaine ABC transporter substrate-binding protein, partial [Rubrivivax sp.]|nr:glycine betaine ABC transporter substrate-binding protein [Rubrivivax sp.]
MSMQGNPPRRLALRSLLAAALAWQARFAQAQTVAAVRVASKIDTEGSLLGQLMLRTLQAHGIRTENRLQLGNTQILRAALLAGQIDLYPEYTGNGAFFLGDEKNPAWRNHAAGHARVKALDAERHQLVWLQPSPANNTWAIALRQDLAQAQRLKSLADLSRYLGGGGRF